MNALQKKIVVLGSTGSIGRNVLEIVAAIPDRFKIVGLTAHSQLDVLAEQARKFCPDWIALTDTGSCGGLPCPQLDCRFVADAVELDRLICDPSVDVVFSAIVGMAGLRGNWAALGAGKTIALANKETLVVAGKLVLGRARQFGAQLIPVDSEHSAIFQAAQAGRASEIEKVILTASGGPFRNKSVAEMAQATVEETLAHPTWNMGKKFTVDSATMMNKALEIIEARWLFDLPAEKIEVVIHPESVIHSLVEFRDGSVLAQLSPPDMRLPIQYALTYPERVPGPCRRMDLISRPPTSIAFQHCGLASKSQKWVGRAE